MVKFEVGTTYYTRSICDHNCIVKFTVLGRTAKTIKVSDGAAEVKKTLRINTNGAGIESVKPWGSYSMAPIVEATDTKELLPDYLEAQRRAQRLQGLLS